MTIIASPNVSRLFGLVLSTPALPSDIREELSRWDTAVDRETDGIDLWAGKIASQIEALGASDRTGIIFPTPPGEPPMCSPNW